MRMVHADRVGLAMVRHRSRDPNDSDRRRLLMKSLMGSAEIGSQLHWIVSSGSLRPFDAVFVHMQIADPGTASGMCLSEGRSTRPCWLCCNFAAGKSQNDVLMQLMTNDCLKITSDTCLEGESCSNSAQILDSPYHCLFVRPRPHRSEGQSSVTKENQ